MSELKLLKLPFLLLVVLIALSFMSSARAATELFLTSARSKFNPKYFSNLTLYTLNGRINADLNITRRLEPGFTARIDIQLRLRNSKRYQTLFIYDFDVCATINALKETLVKRWFKSILKYGNFMEHCPVNQGHYYLHGWCLESSLVPKYLYPGDYRVKGYVFYGRYKKKNEELVVDCEIDAKLI